VVLNAFERFSYSKVWASSLPNRGLCQNDILLSGYGAGFGRNVVPLSGVKKNQESGFLRAFSSGLEQ
jgi:hypothetical protein